jgi:hypothetical protein
MERVLRDGTKETIHVLIGSGRGTLSGVTGITVQSSDKTTTTTISVVGDESKGAVSLMTTTGVVNVNNDRYQMEDQPKEFHVQNGRLSISRTDDGYNIETKTMLIQLSAWTASETTKHKQRTFFDIAINSKLPKDGSTKGACGAADIQTSGPSHISCHLVPLKETLFTTMQNHLNDYIDGGNFNGGTKCDITVGVTRTQEAKVETNTVTEADMVVAKSCKPGSNLMKMTIAACSIFLPKHFPTGIDTMGDEKLSFVNKCYFVSCGGEGNDTADNVKKGVDAATRMQNAEHRRNKCTVPKEEREKALAQPPLSLAALQIKIKDGSLSDVCLE